ncbi:MAG: hypothetical protein RSD14_05715, partial [Clostridia bacterium]
KIKILEESLGINIDTKKIILNILNFTLYKFDDHEKEDICNIAWGRLYNGKINKACIRAKRMIYNIEALRGIPAPNGKREERN